MLVYKLAVQVVQLKRFELDMTTFTNQKVNDRLTFPLTLNLKPYTAEGLAEAEAGDATDEKASPEVVRCLSI